LPLNTVSCSFTAYLSGLLAEDKPICLTVYTALENFLLILSYWSAIYIPITLIESLIIRGPASLITFPPSHFDDWHKLPIGLAAVAAMICVRPTMSSPD
jgi:purine-cytosine permease-like protein